MVKNRETARKLGILILSFLLMAAALIASEFMEPTEPKPPAPPKSSSSTCGSTSQPDTLPNPDQSPSEHTLTQFARQHGLQLDAWPEELRELLARNPDAEEFVLHYPLKKDKTFPIDLGQYKTCPEVPLLLQWDERWGYTRYGDNLMGLTGCGPTCLSMVCIYLLGRTDLSPRAIADFAESHGYYAIGKGSIWTLFSDGGTELGLDVWELPLDENRIIRELTAGRPIICAMGPGDFTASGHFIVLTDFVDGKFRLNDPNSPSRSERLWSYSELNRQIRNLWAFGS